MIIREICLTVLLCSLQGVNKNMFYSSGKQKRLDTNFNSKTKNNTFYTIIVFILK